MSSKSGECLPGRTFPEYFTELAINYSRSTGDSTYKVIEKVLQSASPPLVTKDSIVSDNACGPGTATAAIIDYLKDEPRLIEANDTVPAMIDATTARVLGEGWKNVKTSNADSHELPFPDDTFTFAVSNINVSTYKDPFKCVQEMYRTLKPKGLAVLTIWKRFAAADLIHNAQVRIRHDATLMPVPKAEFMREGYLAEMVQNAGFQAVESKSTSVYCTGDEIDGIRGFMLGDFTRTVRAPWSDKEIAQWPDAVNAAIDEEVKREGGIRFDAWVVSGRK